MKEKEEERKRMKESERGGGGKRREGGKSVFLYDRVLAPLSPHCMLHAQYKQTLNSNLGIVYKKNCMLRSIDWDQNQ